MPPDTPTAYRQAAACIPGPEKQAAVCFDGRVLVDHSVWDEIFRRNKERAHARAPLKQQLLVLGLYQVLKEPGQTVLLVLVLGAQAHFVESG